MLPALLFAALLQVAAEGAAPGTPPDLVRTKAGGMARGTIVEIVPGGAVRIQLSTGEMRVFPAAEIEYAGPAAQAPGAGAPAGGKVPSAEVPAGLRVARLRMISDQEGVTFYHKTGMSSGIGTGWVLGRGGGPLVMGIHSEQFTRLCTAPCDVDLPQGDHLLGLALNDARVVPAQIVDLRGPTEVRGEYTSRWGVRTTGAWLIAGGIVGGISMVAAGYALENAPLVIAGGTAFLIGMPVGIGLLFVKDSADVYVR